MVFRGRLVGHQKASRYYLARRKVFQRYGGSSSSAPTFLIFACEMASLLAVSKSFFVRQYFGGSISPAPEMSHRVTLATLVAQLPNNHVIGCGLRGAH